MTSTSGGRGQLLGHQRPARRIRGEPGAGRADAARLPTTTGCSSPATSPRPSPTSTGPSASLASRFAKVVWAPGNHELWTHPEGPGHPARRRALRAPGRALPRAGRDHPRGPLPGVGRPRRPGRRRAAVPALRLHVPARRLRHQGRGAGATRTTTGVVCTDEYLLHPDPYPSREAWCGARVPRPSAGSPRCPADLPTVLVNHYPLVRDPTEVLRYPEFAMWCGTERTADWHRRFRVAAMVYGHLHIPRTTWHDGRPLRGGLGGLSRASGERPAAARATRAASCPTRRCTTGDRGAAARTGGGRGDATAFDDTGQAPALPGGGGAGRAGGRQAAARVHHRPRPARAGPWRSSACRPQPVLPGERGAPRWPAGVVGSMTHCAGYRAAALVRAADLASLGIDAEPHGPLPEGVLRRVALPAERERLRAAGRAPARRPLGPAAVQRQGVRLQGVVPADRAVARLRGGGHRADGRTRSIRAAAPSAPPSSCPALPWAGGASTALRRPLERPRRPGRLGGHGAARLRRRQGSGPAARLRSSRKNSSSLPVRPAACQGQVRLGEYRGRDDRRAGGAGRSRRGVEGGPHRVQQPQIGLHGGALVVGQYGGGGHRPALPTRRRRSRAAPHGGGTPSSLPSATDNRPPNRAPRHRP